MLTDPRPFGATPFAGGSATNVGYSVVWWAVPPDKGEGGGRGVKFTSPTEGGLWEKIQNKPRWWNW
ncbi:MAG: hypothetical protein LBU27_00975 [Candidatus Peribacteria bacterium]|nr:hypothetical protein [Candidatus Peribacteria bacterium]